MDGVDGKSIRRPWNHGYNWIIALVGAIAAFSVLLGYHWTWLPALFRSLLADGLPGDDPSSVYTVTSAIFVVPGILTIIAVVIWDRIRSRATAIIAIVVAALALVICSPGAPFGRYTGNSKRDLAVQGMLRAGADPDVADAWGGAVYVGCFIGGVLVALAGLFAAVRVIRRGK